VTHVEALDCPCRPETRRQLGGGRVQVHRDLEAFVELGLDDGRFTPTDRAMDRLCRVCTVTTFHLVGHPHLAPA
jgi:hypothetical protein